jgi:radical SAM protein with 4Fe4S-binding SPASM domain
MTVGQVSELAEEARRFAKPGDRILVQWHGGEPTALGAKHMRSCLEALKAEGAEFKWLHGIQTNLINYSDEWKDIYKEYFESSIGVSWDPEIRLLRRNRPETNDEYELTFWNNVKALIKDGISPYLVITGTKIFFERFINPFALFDFLEEKGIRRAHIERLTKTGYARESWAKIGISNLENSTYMGRLASAYNIYRKLPRKEEQPLNISPFDGLFESVERLKIGESGGYGCLSGDCDSKYHTLDANGYKPGCTAITSEIDNINAKGETLQFIDISAAREDRQKSCVGCKYIPICSSGCIATTKVDFSGECAGGFKLFQRLEKIL